MWILATFLFEPVGCAGHVALHMPEKRKQSEKDFTFLESFGKSLALDRLCMRIAILQYVLSA